MNTLMVDGFFAAPGAGRKSAMLHLKDQGARCWVDAASLGAGVFDLSDDDSDIIRDAKKRWNSRFPVENGDLSFADEYMEGRRDISVNLKIVWKHKSIQFIANISSNCKFIYGAVPNNCIFYNDLSDSKDGDNSSVLVQVGEFVKCGDRRVPSVVRLYLVDDEVPQRLGDGILFRSLSQGGYKSLSVASNWEKHLAADIIFGSNGVGESMVEGLPKVVDSVAENHRDAAIERLAYELNDCLSGAGISIINNFMSFSRNTGNKVFEISDMMLSSF